MNDQSDNNLPDDRPQPVAYDTEGRPLYHHPPQQDSQSGSSVATSESGQPETIEVDGADGTHQYVHFRRSLAPEKADIPPEIKRKHEEAVKAYPNLNLSEGEYIIRAIGRHPIGMIVPIAITLFLILAVGAMLISIPLLSTAIGLGPSAYGALFVIGLLIMVLFAIGGYIAVWVYSNNRFYLTNESVIQEIQTSLFARHEQTVSLGNIEDASFQQQGVLPHMFDYGLIRLSTEGDETTYRFAYASHPKDQIAVLNNAVEAFKNGRPIE